MGRRGSATLVGTMLLTSDAGESRKVLSGGEALLAPVGVAAEHPRALSDPDLDRPASVNRGAAAAL